MKVWKYFLQLLTSYKTDIDFKPVTGFPLESVTPTTCWVTGFPLESVKCYDLCSFKIYFKIKI